MVSGSSPVVTAIVEAISRFDGPAKGMRLRPNDVPKATRISRMVANLFSPALTVGSWFPCDVKLHISSSPLYEKTSPVSTFIGFFT
jgi:hypothetical protein